MKQDILTLIRENMGSFSKGQKRIAAFILDSYDKAAFMTASKLGQTVHVSESTVVRFAAELGYDGYPSMQKSLQKMIRSRLTSVQRIEMANDQMGNDVVSSVLRSDIAMIRSTLDELDRSRFNSAVDAILKAKMIYIMGVRSSSAISRFMAFHFNLIFDNICEISANTVSEVFEQILRVGPEDVVIGTAARFDAVKDLATLLRGFAMAAERDGRLKLVLAGAGPEEEMLRTLAKELAQTSGAVVVLSGDWDIVTDGTASYRVGNGHPMMRSVTGTGCQMSALIGAYAAANPDKTLCAALAGVCAFGLCGEIAFGRLGPQDGNATYRNYLIDGVYHLTEKALEEGAKYEIC